MKGRLKSLKDLENEKSNEPENPEKNVKKEKVVLGKSEVKTKKKGKS